VDEEEDDEQGYAHVIIPGAIFGIIAVTILIYLYWRSKKKTAPAVEQPTTTVDQSVNAEVIPQDTTTNQDTTTSQDVDEPKCPPPSYDAATSKLPPLHNERHIYFQSNNEPV